MLRRTLLALALTATAATAEAQTRTRLPVYTALETEQLAPL